jgi:hypothetical protein
MSTNMENQAKSFTKAHNLAERLYEMQSNQMRQVIAGVEALGKDMTFVKTDVALIKLQTADLPKRVLALENLRFKAAAFIAAILFIMWVVQVAPTFLKH